MTRSNSRRRFLRQTTASLMGLVAGGFWTSTAAIASRSALEKLRLGAIGVGNRGEANITALKSEDWVALCDVDRRFLDQMHDRYPAAKTYRDFRELLDHRDLDAVVVSSPDHTHYHAARPALQRKLHVYCEKPLAHSVAEAHQLAEAARQANVVAQMGNQHHSSEGYRQVVALLRAEALGRVSEVHSWSNRPLWPQGISRPPAGGPAPEYLDWNLWLGPAPTRPYHESYHPFNWRGWWDFGTGALGDMGPHLLDPAFAGLDLTEPEHVEAETSEVDAEASDDHKPESAPKASVVRFRFPARGTRPAVNLTWYDGGQLPPASVTGTEVPPANGTLILGELGKIFVPELGGRPLVIPKERGQKIEKPMLRPTPGHHQAWLEACKSGTPAPSDFDYASQLTATCLLGNVAIRCGHGIRWDAERRTTGQADADALLQREYRDW